MDKKKDCKIPKCGIPASFPKGSFVVGAKQLKKAVRNGRCAYVYLAENADPAVTEPLEALCAENFIHIIWVPTMAELGRECGIEVGAACAAILKFDSNG